MDRPALWSCLSPPVPGKTGMVRTPPRRVQMGSIMSAMPETVHGEDVFAIHSDVLEIRSHCRPQRTGRLKALFVHIRFTCLFVNYGSLAGVCLG